MTNQATPVRRHNKGVLWRVLQGEDCAAAQVISCGTPHPPAPYFHCLGCVTKQGRSCCDRRSPPSLFDSSDKSPKLTLVMSDTVPSFHPKHTTEARTAQLQRLKRSHKEHFTETDRHNIKYSAYSSLLPGVLTSLLRTTIKPFNSMWASWLKSSKLQSSKEELLRVLN